MIAPRGLVLIGYTYIAPLASASTKLRKESSRLEKPRQVAARQTPRTVCGYAASQAKVKTENARVGETLASAGDVASPIYWPTGNSAMPDNCCCGPVRPAANDAEVTRLFGQHRLRVDREHPEKGIAEASRSGLGTCLKLVGGQKKTHRTPIKDSPTSVSREVYRMKLRGRL